MSLLSEWHRQWTIRRLQKQVRREPHIATFVALVERHLFHGELAEAQRVAETALARYPDSQRLATLLAQVRKGSVRTRIDELRRGLASDPTPEAFGRLAELYLSLGETGRALRLAAECARRFPEHENASWIEGRIRLDRFRKNHEAKEGKAALEALEQVVARNCDHARARRLLAEVYLEVGARALALPHLEELARTDGSDEAVAKALAELRGAPPEPANLDEILRSAEEGHAADLVPEVAGSDERITRLRERATKLARTRRGIVASAVLAPGDKPDPTRWDGAAGRIAQLADGALRRMDLGGLHDLRLSGPFGHLFAFGADGAWVLFLCAESTRFEDVGDAALEAISEARACSSEAKP